MGWLVEGLVYGFPSITVTHRRRQKKKKKKKKKKRRCGCRSFAAMLVEAETDETNELLGTKKKKKEETRST
jgi:hypothetical protein